MNFDVVRIAYSLVECCFTSKNVILRSLVIALSQTSKCSQKALSSYSSQKNKHLAQLSTSSSIINLDRYANAQQKTHLQDSLIFLQEAQHTCGPTCKHHRHI
ncbi:12404_t:CDS:1 [Cetraspora pellucida]|uniref:12404_t:CDS:1 n=1 Tax=Cetraspora pellucida TaxID=1433469 RepID=A0ACA9KC39_9GLOM|nr:12404_t:CDS:1 [Cetraspora pellucida]